MANKLEIYPQVVWFGRPNKYGLYNMVGNISEMTNVKGIAKGINYLMYIDSAKITDDISYSKPAKWLGFRCICEVLKK